MELRIWLALITVAVVAKGIATWRLNRRETRIEQAILRVERMLCVWADHWDDAPADMKARLQEVRHDRP